MAFSIPGLSEAMENMQASIEAMNEMNASIKRIAELLEEQNQILMSMNDTREYLPDTF